MQVLTQQQAYNQADARRAVNGDADKMDIQSALDAIKNGADPEHIWLHDDRYSDAARELARMWFEYGALSDADLRECGFDA